jgi:hypothetical protein
MVYQANAYRFWSAENGENCDQLLDFGSILGYFLKKKHHYQYKVITWATTWVSLAKELGSTNREIRSLEPFLPGCCRRSSPKITGVQFFSLLWVCSSFPPKHTHTAESRI